MNACSGLHMHSTVRGAGERTCGRQDEAPQEAESLVLTADGNLFTHFYYVTMSDLSTKY